MEWKNMKISESLSKSKYMVFNIKKLLNVGVDLILRRKGEKKWYSAEWVADFADLGCRWWVFASERVNNDATKHFWDSMWSPGYRGHILA